MGMAIGSIDKTLAKAAITAINERVFVFVGTADHFCITKVSFCNTLLISFVAIISASGDSFNVWCN